jgi:ATP dependent DNA ligase C terminal region
MPSSNSVKLARRFCTEKLECPWLRKCRETGDPLPIDFSLRITNGRSSYVARTRNGFTPALREELFQRFRRLQTAKCTFANLPEARSGRPLGSRPHDEENGSFSYLQPQFVGHFKFTEWTPDDHLKLTGSITVLILTVRAQNTVWQSNKVRRGYLK